MPSKLETLATLNNLYIQMTSSVFDIKNFGGNKRPVPIPINEVSNGFENVDCYVSNLIDNADIEFFTRNDIKTLWADIERGMYTENHSLSILLKNDLKKLEPVY